MQTVVSKQPDNNSYLLSDCYRMTLNNKAGWSGLKLMQTHGVLFSMKNNDSHKSYNSWLCQHFRFLSTVFHIIHRKMWSSSICTVIQLHVETWNATLAKKKAVKQSKTRGMGMMSSCTKQHEATVFIMNIYWLEADSSKVFICSWALFPHMTLTLADHHCRSVPETDVLLWRCTASSEWTTCACSVLSYRCNIRTW